MNKFGIFLILSSAMLLSVGCATKSYVRQQVVPLVSKVQGLDQQTSENTTGIQNLKTRMQQSEESSKANAQQMNQKNDTANSEAQQATHLANACNKKAAALAGTMSNLDNYHVVARTLLEFGVNKSELNADAKQQLDQLGEGMSSNKTYLVVVQGGTDNSGSERYNYDLSQRRAEEVVRYLVAKYNVPLYKVYAVGVGEQRPVAPNDTADGRKKNRRAEIELMSNAGQPVSKEDDSDSDEQAGLAEPHR
jgi:OmpA-OmpF porin, OOP family